MQTESLQLPVPLRRVLQEYVRIAGLSCKAHETLCRTLARLEQVGLIARNGIRIILTEIRRENAGRSHQSHHAVGTEQRYCGRTPRQTTDEWAIR